MDLGYRRPKHGGSRCQEVSSEREALILLEARILMPVVFRRDIITTLLQRIPQMLFPLKSHIRVEGCRTGAHEDLSDTVVER